MMQEYYLQPNPVAPADMIVIDETKCIACNACVNICRTQTIMPHPEPKTPPVVIYPDECWLCGCCVEACSTGALRMRIPANQKIFYKRKETDKIYRIDQKDAPAQSWFDPPIG